MQTGRQILDLLFISHLDRDHVNGLDQLLALVRAQTAVLPYLSAFERLQIVAEAVASGHVSMDFLRLLADPAGWLLSRGVARVIFIFGDDNFEGSANGPIPPPWKLPREPHRLDQRRPVSEGERLTLDFDYLEVFRLDTVPIYLVPHTVLLQLKDAHDWCFLPFVHPADDHIQQFRLLIEQRFGPIPTDGMANWLISIIQDVTQRNELGDCYWSFDRDRNHTSMSLYSGPSYDYGTKAFECRVTFVGRPILTSVCGWLGTGDDALRVKERRNRFKNHYANVFEQGADFRNTAPRLG